MSFKTSTFTQKIQVPYTFPVVFTHGLLNPKNPVLADLLRDAGRAPHKYLLGIDDGLQASFPNLAEDLRRYFEHYPGLATEAHTPVVVPGGEAAKSGWNTVREIMTAIGNGHLDRHSFVIAIGGGSLLDIVGFAAAIVHRGIRLIRIPTTVLAQCDAAVGVKNGMDEHGQKNFVGTFAPPYAVLNDLSMLDALPDRYWIGGISEIFKVSIIKDAQLFEVLRKAAPALRRRDAEALEPLLIKSAQLHLDHIREGGDPFEMGSARPLDFGHWSAHKLEHLSHHDLNHGEAVAIGVALDSCYAALKGLISGEELRDILEAMKTVGLPLWHPSCDTPAASGRRAVLDGLEEFREHLGGDLTITLPKGIGARVEVNDMDTATLESACRELKAFAVGL